MFSVFCIAYLQAAPWKSAHSLRLLLNNFVLSYPFATKLSAIIQTMLIILVLKLHTVLGSGYIVLCVLFLNRYIVSIMSFLGNTEQDMCKVVSQFRILYLYSFSHRLLNVVCMCVCGCMSFNYNVLKCADFGFECRPQCGLTHIVIRSISIWIN